MYNRYETLFILVRRIILTHDITSIVERSRDGHVIVVKRKTVVERLYDSYRTIKNLYNN